MSKEKSATSEANEEVFYTMIPARKQDRIYSAVDLTAIQVCFGIGAWFFLVGSQTGMWLEAKVAIPTIIFGNTFGLLLMAPIAIISARYGVEQMLGTVTIFGQRFTIVNLLMFCVTAFCAIALATLMFGKSAVRLCSVILGPDNILSLHPVAWALFALVMGFISAAAGPKAMKNFVRTSASLMILVLVGLVIYIFTQYGADAIFAAKPATPIVVEGDPSLSFHWNVAAGFEINIGLGLSWTYWYGQWTRLAKSEAGGYHGCMWGWGGLAAAAGVFAALAALAIQTYDPTAWLIDVAEKTGSVVLPVIGLLLFALANITSVATVIYPGAITFRTHYPKLPWKASLAIATIPGFALIVIPGFYDKIASIYAIIGALCVLYGAIIVVDYHFISKGIYDMRRVFNKKEGYMYFHGINPAAAIAEIIGAAFYLWTYNPFTMASANGWFPYITAGVPTCILTGLVYYILMKTWVMKVWPQPLTLQK